MDSHDVSLNMKSGAFFKVNELQTWSLKAKIWRKFRYWWIPLFTSCPTNFSTISKKKAICNIFPYSTFTQLPLKMTTKQEEKVKREKKIGKKNETQEPATEKIYINYVKNTLIFKFLLSSVKYALNIIILYFVHFFLPPLYKKYIVFLLM